MDDEPVTSGVTFGLIAFVIFLVVCFAAVRFGTANIERDLERRSGLALAAAGFDQVDVAAHGTTVSLSGTYLPHQDETVAFAAVAGLSGIGEVDGQIWEISVDDLDTPIVSGAPFEATWTNGAIVITGNVSTEEKLAFIEITLDDAIAEEGSAVRSYDISGVIVKEGLPDESAWLGSILALVKNAPATLPVGLIRADGGNRYVVISGDVLDRTVRDDLNARVVETAEALGFDANPAVRLLDEGPTVEEVQDLQDELNDLVLDQVVEFEIDSFALTVKGRSLLDELLMALDGAPDDIRVLITGHTDNAGDQAENQLLSEQRARAVLDYLVTAGQDPDRFDIIGYGETQPIASNDTELGRARNRRIEFTALLQEDG